MSQKPLQFKITKHKSTDPLDVGFKIAGHDLRWLHSYQTEGNLGRPWRVLRKEILPVDLVKQLEDANYGIFSQGETIRRGDLVLSFAPTEVVDMLRREEQEKADEQLRMISRNPPNTKQVFVDQRETSVERVGPEHFNR